MIFFRGGGGTNSVVGLAALIAIDNIRTSTLPVVIIHYSDWLSNTPPTMTSVGNSSNTTNVGGSSRGKGSTNNLNDLALL